jgi:hypothetical protein
VLRRRHDPCVDGLLIRIERRLLAVHHRKVGPSLFRTLVTAITDVERKDVPCLLVHGNLHSWRVRFLRHTAPQLTGFHLQTPNERVPRSRDRPHRQMIRQRGKAGSHKTREPSDTDAHGPANAMQRDFLTE